MFVKLIWLVWSVLLCFVSGVDCPVLFGVGVAVVACCVLLLYDLNVVSHLCMLFCFLFQCVVWCVCFVCGFRLFVRLCVFVRLFCLSVCSFWSGLCCSVVLCVVLLCCMPCCCYCI